MLQMETAESYYGLGVRAALGAAVIEDPEGTTPVGPALITRLAELYGAPAAEWAVRLHPPRGILYRRPDRTADSPQAFAFANHGVWKVSCPWCSSSQFSSETDRRFFCAGCLNAAAGGAFIPVSWPVDAQAIEELLLLRPDPANRNWHPGEMLADLRLENVAFLPAGS